MKEDIVGMMFKDVEVGLIISDTITFTTADKVLMVMGEVDIGLITNSLTSTIHMILVDHWIFIVVVIT